MSTLLGFPSQEIPHYEIQYLSFLQEVLRHGKWTPPNRTGKRTKALIGRTFVIDVANSPYPVITTRDAPTLMPIAEKHGYDIGLSNAADFEKLGAKTWYANANETQAWVNNPNRKGKDDCGRIYGVQGRQWQAPNGKSIDQLANVINDLKRGVDNRGEIVTYYNPGEFDYGCLRPCMHTHQFSLLDGELFLESYQRSADLPLGTVANIQQVYYTLKLMASIVGAVPRTARLHMANIHIYEDQLELAEEQVSRKPYLDVKPELIISPDIKSIEDLDAIRDKAALRKAFQVTGYDKFHPKIQYPFAA